MAKPKLRPADRNAISAHLIETLRADFAGQLISPADADYDSARRIWNASIDKYPSLIARCTGTADIISVVKFARANDLPVSVRGGGHNVAGRALCDDGIVIDLSAMKGIIVDPLQRTVRVQAGALLRDVDRETHAYGLAVPAGIYSGTGIAGLTLGGGVGWLVRKYGLSCDNVISFEVVTADGALLSASDDSNPDLFWALRGSGGNLGIVTSFTFRAHPVSTVLGGIVVYPRDQAVAVLRHCRDFMISAPEDLTVFAGLITTPDGHPAVAFAACYCGSDLAEGERVLKPLRAFGSPMLDAIQPMPFKVMQTLFDGNVVDRSYNYWKSTLLKELSDDAIGTMVEHGNRAGSPISGVFVQFYAGALNRLGQDDPATALRQATVNINIDAQWVDAAENDVHIAWTRETWRALQPFSSGRFTVNFTSDTGDDVNRVIFGGSYARLAELKAKYDPTNFFSLNRNIAASAKG